MPPPNFYLKVCLMCYWYLFDVSFSICLLLTSMFYFALDISLIRAYTLKLNKELQLLKHMLYSYYINRYIWTYFYHLIFSVNHVFFAAASFFQNLCLSSKQYKDLGILSHWQLPLHFVVILVWIILFIIDFQLKIL